MLKSGKNSTEVAACILCNRTSSFHAMGETCAHTWTDAANLLPLGGAEGMFVGVGWGLLLACAWRGGLEQCATWTSTNICLHLFHG